MLVKAGDAKRVYGSQNPIFTGAIEGIQNGDAIAASYSLADQSSPAGTYAIVPSLSGAALTNYAPPSI